MKNTMKAWVESQGLGVPIAQASGDCDQCGDKIDWKLGHANAWRGTYELYCDHGSVRSWLDFGGEA